MLFTDKYDTSATLKALSFRYRGRVSRSSRGTPGHTWSKMRCKGGVMSDSNDERSPRISLVALVEFATISGSRAECAPDAFL